MRQFLSAVALILVGTALFIYQVTAAPSPTLRQSIFIVTIDNESRCTAFAAGDQKFVTAFHCLRSLNSVLQLYDASGNWWEAALDSVDPEVDTAVFTSEMPAEALRIDTALPLDKDWVYTLASVRGYTGLFALHGWVAYADGSTIIVQMPGWTFGSSGSPIICQNGAVCGMATHFDPELHFIGVRPTVTWQHLLTGD